MKEESSADILQQWRDKRSQEEGLFLRILQENEKLKSILEDINVQNFSMKSTIRILQQDKERQESLTAELYTKLAESANAIKRKEPDRNLVWSLIDGDGYVFLPELLKKGEAGGRDAALMLRDGIAQYLAKLPDSPSNPIMWAMIFLSKERLEAVLSRTETCSVENFKLFVKGFSKAHPLFSFIEVGASKEAADYKIREHLNKLVGNRQMYKILVGVDHDNGYGAALSAELTAGHENRLVLLKAHDVVATEIAALGLPTAEIPGLFMNEKLVIKAISPKVGYSYAIMASPEVTGAAEKGSPGSTVTKLPASKGPPPGLAKPSVWKRDSSLPQRDPPPCNLFYLTGNCQHMDYDCEYGHKYVLSEAERKQLALGAQQQPCKFANKDQECWIEHCIYGHKCPRGPLCSFYAAKTCKFEGKGMHTR